MSPVFKNVRERPTAKNYHRVSLLSVVSKVFEKLAKRIVDHLEKCSLFLISSMVLGLLNQLQVFSQLYLIELLGLLTDLGLLELWHLIYPRLLTGFSMLVFFTNLSLMEFQARYLTYRQLWVVLDVKSSHKYLINAGVPQGPFSVLHFSYHTLMIFLMMLFVILLSMLMVLLSTLNEIRHLICGSS